MPSFSTRQRYYLFRTATDMRKGFSGLGGLVREHLEYDLMLGDVFIFMNKRRDPTRKRGPLNPIYSSTPGVGQNWIRGLVQGARTGHIRAPQPPDADC